MKDNLKLYGKAYASYMELLSSGNTYSILLSKRLLLRPILPVWIFFFFLFLIPDNVFFMAVVLPCLFLTALYLMQFYPFWHACAVSAKAYMVFHILAFISVWLLSRLAVSLSEVLWIFFI